MQIRVSHVMPMNPRSTVFQKRPRRTTKLSIQHASPSDYSGSIVAKKLEFIMFALFEYPSINNIKDMVIIIKAIPTRPVENA
ncbi:hypothetical protein N7468_001963 [Penicillium chermesinum]|uniref:Uncharacterized protein n=1 Tax=Penicillium chermesinum TaxID=63820 RepID=A0A9W9PHJ8_9EURO|nr:uncharacterized protein N7468_001963 [Penicillium chermesinum]KAJ5246980.1 hypothetical protein N7468_001963 [Penicillium chermesinum]